MAEVATSARVAEIQRVDAQRARHEARSAEQAEQIADVLRKTVLRFEVKSGPTGSLFGSVTPSDVADEIWRTRKVRVDRRKILMDPIKRIGRYTVPIEVFQDVLAEVKTLVVPEGGELPPEEELAALEAAEAEAAAAAAKEAETEHVEAETAIAEVLEVEEAPEVPEVAEMDEAPEALEAEAVAESAGSAPAGEVDTEAHDEAAAAADGRPDLAP
jgi:large subunit ribosomal protein L9